jgi:hypothetical protein
LRVYKVADIIGNEIVLCAARGQKAGDLAALLTNAPLVYEPRPDANWQLEVTVGEGAATRTVKLTLPPLLSIKDSTDSPVFVCYDRLVFFSERLFMPERAPKSAAEREEIILRAKKLVYEEQADLANLRAAVANLEAAIEYSKSGPRRIRIPEDVRLLVWARDGGACVRCGSKAGLHFDHVIPVAKGGSNVEANIQILCGPCNLRKSDKIAVP